VVNKEEREREGNREGEEERGREGERDSGDIYLSSVH
jgi:hypothetical protein